MFLTVKQTETEATKQSLLGYAMGLGKVNNDTWTIESSFSTFLGAYLAGEFTPKGPRGVEKKKICRGMAGLRKHTTICCACHQA